MRIVAPIVVVLMLLLGTACQKAHEIPVGVAALAEAARWEGAHADLALGEGLRLSLWVCSGPSNSNEPLEIDMVLPVLDAGEISPQGPALQFEQDNKRYWTRTYRLTWLRLGEQVLPSFDVHLKQAGKKLSTQSLDFVVAGVLTDRHSKEVEIPIELLQDAPVSRTSLYLWLGALALAILVGWWLQRRLRGEMHQVALGPQVSPIDEARQRLADVQRQWSAKQLDGGSLVVAVSQVLRTYLQKGMGFHSLTHTTEEFLAELRSSDRVPMDVEAPLGGFLQQCDLIKFAAQDTNEDLCSSLLNKTGALLDEAHALQAARAAQQQAELDSSHAGHAEVVQRG